MTMKDQHNEPATKGDIAELRHGIDDRFDGIDRRVDRVEERIERLERNIVQLSQDVESFEEEAAALHEETRRYFDVVAEKIFHDAIGARKDEIESLKDGKADHERRIRRLERSAGLIAA
jgi:prefoldin subunit 5